MKAFRYFSLAVCALTGAYAQSSSPVLDAETGIPYEGYYNPTYGVSYRAVFPPISGGAQSTEFIGQIIAPNAAKWIGWALGGAMLNNPLVMVWPNNGTFVVSPRWATDYVQPTLYTGPTITTLSASYQNSTHWKWVFRCQKCTTWTGGSGSFDTNGTPVFAWAYSNIAVDQPSNVSSTFAEHTDFGFFGFNAVNAHQADYSTWTSTGTGSHTTITTTTTSSTSTPTVKPTPVAAFDYIVVGGGAGGLVAADRLSETGKRVLLIERGGPSYGSLGGTEIPTWANGTKLTRFDVPGLFESEFSGNTWWWCKDISFFAGCLLGGGTAINGLLFWYPTDVEFTASNGWPSGWQDVGTYSAKVQTRVKATNNPSGDGKRYLDQVYTVVSNLLKPQGFVEGDINGNPNWKDHIYGHSSFDAIGGQRTGPLASYYQTFKARPNVTIALYTYAQALTRNKGQITGVRTNNTAVNGNGTYTLTSKGRVIVSAGAYGTARLLISSGIGPTDQIQTVQQNTEYTKYLPAQADWINLPVGYNVQDNPSINFVFEHPDVDSYDNWGLVWDNPRPADAQLYLKSRSGPLASASPKINFWKAMNGSDGRTRYVQGTSRPGACCMTNPAPYNESRIFTITSYLSVGITSRGRIGIDPEMRAKPLVNPWFTDPVDKAVMITHLNDMISSMSTIPNLRLVFPANYTSAGITDFVNNYDPSAMNSNHWMGSAKIGTSSSNSVVDPNTKVWNTNNLFVVDASIVPGMPMGNPTFALLTMAEMASAKILALAGGP